ncbi:FkbM family methyltransferase [Paenibacillus woosongensis]|uniref:FkbM family methyltransferase n=1 Tax=Paenibacillus woosongensis TaxID=307580 RepID=A0A7X2Z5B4_9BACL|nr:FkbM family methyltransferase [Paenibacillus woosongensis]MUG47156.1 FkbM family methyltransferase [Paenibacillus woosongensis]
MFGTYIGNDKMLVKLAYNGFLTISSKDLSLMPTLVLTGMFEVPLTKYFLTNIKPGQTVVDVGTNVGYFTVLASKLVGNQGSVIGFEANPELVLNVKDNLAMNWLTENVKIINKAVYSKNTKIKFHISEKFHGYSSIHEKPEDENLIDSYTANEVTAVSLDSELYDIEQIDLLKIDIEGGEYQAFQGMMGLIEKKKIKKITFEWNKPMLGDETESFLMLISDLQNRLGGRLYLIDQEGNPVPTTLKEISSVDFYPFALIEF